MCKRSERLLEREDRSMSIANKKLFVVKFNIGYDDDFTLCKAFAGHLSASQYVES